jgi:lipopolysaccharide transport system ATP-binding protein
MPAIITVDSLSKKYLLSHRNREQCTSLRDVVAEKCRDLGRLVLHPFNHLCSVDEPGAKEEFWALKDVSFQVDPGDRLGIIGRNGAGKSTLLKVLSRIVEPTAGSVGIRGRIASLLEVGTGFHPELTGRENIYLNGSILGMTRAEICRKFDEIVTFAEVERFLDTPVKRYSSGMYVRLAFAVAAHLEPEILIVDEVLAVGDVQFQAKCLGKMEEVGREGRTILFVSHNLGVLSQLCNKGVLLDGGMLIHTGSIEDCVNRYLARSSESSTDLVLVREITERTKVVIERVLLVSESGFEGVVDNASPACLEVTFWVEVPGTSYAIAAELSGNTMGVVLTSSTLDSRPAADLGRYRQRGRYLARLALPTGWLLAGTYRIRVSATIPSVEVLDIFPHEIQFCLSDSSSPVAVLGEGRRGVIAPRLQWSVEAAQE